MSPVLTRLALAAAGLGIVGTTSLANAATGPKALSFTDPSGDALTGAAYDITKVEFTTTGTKVGRTYTPKKLVVRMTIAGSFASTPGVNYEVDADLAGCGYTNFTYTPGAQVAGGLFTECGSAPDATGSTATLYDEPPTVTGSTVTWTFSLKGLSPEFKAGALFSGISALTVQNDPVFGIIGPGVVGANFDDASTHKTYKIG